MARVCAPGTWSAYTQAGACTPCGQPPALISAPMEQTIAFASQCSTTARRRLLTYAPMAPRFAVFVPADGAATVRGGWPTAQCVPVPAAGGRQMCEVRSANPQLKL
jgi:hypothetical protein